MTEALPPRPSRVRVHDAGRAPSPMTDAEKLDEIRRLCNDFPPDAFASWKMRDEVRAVLDAPSAPAARAGGIDRVRRDTAKAVLDRVHARAVSDELYAELAHEFGVRSAAPPDGYAEFEHLITDRPDEAWNLAYAAGQENPDRTRFVDFERFRSTVLGIVGDKS